MKNRIFLGQILCVCRTTTTLGGFCPPLEKSLQTPMIGMHLWLNKNKTKYFYWLKTENFEPQITCNRILPSSRKTLIVENRRRILLSGNSIFDPSAGFNFTIILRAAFTWADPKSSQKTVKSSSFLPFWDLLAQKLGVITLIKLTPGPASQIQILILEMRWSEQLLSNKLPCFIPKNILFLILKWVNFTKFCTTKKYLQQRVIEIDCFNEKWSF